MPLAIRLFLALAINAAALWVANSLFSGVHIHGWWAYIIGAAVLGIANTVIKPVLALITLPLIILTLGLFLLVINIAMVGLAEWIAPNFSIWCGANPNIFARLNAGRAKQNRTASASPRVDRGARSPHPDRR